MFVLDLFSISILCCLSNCEDAPVALVEEVHILKENTEAATLEKPVKCKNTI